MRRLFFLRPSRPSPAPPTPSPTPALSKEKRSLQHMSRGPWDRGPNLSGPVLSNPHGVLLGIRNQTPYRWKARQIQFFARTLPTVKEVRRARPPGSSHAGSAGLTDRQTNRGTDIEFQSKGTAVGRIVGGRCGSEVGKRSRELSEGQNPEEDKLSQTARRSGRQAGRRDATSLEENDADEQARDHNLHENGHRRMELEAAPPANFSAFPEAAKFPTWPALSRLLFYGSSFRSFYPM